MTISPEWFESVASGRRTGWSATLTRAALTAVSVPYRFVTDLRNTLYDRRWLAVETPDVPVLSVGNMTLGGTGKTPVVALIARRLLDRGFHPGLVSRGYKASHTTRDKSLDDPFAQYIRFNDEAKELDLLLEGRVPHFLCPDRVRAVRALRSFDPKIDVVLLDDAFQHRRIGRTLDIVLLDALEPFGFERVFPRGTLRESVSGLRRARLVLLNRADLVEKERADAICDRVKRISPNAVVAPVACRPRQVLRYGDEPVPFDLWKKRIGPARLYAFCGIGNPTGFLKLLTGEHLNLVGHDVCPDHAAYSDSVLDRIGRDAALHGADALVTTLKDAVKIERSALAGLPLYTVAIGIDFLAGEEDAWTCICNAVS